MKLFVCTAAVCLAATGSIALAQDPEEAVPAPQSQANASQEEESDEDEYMQEVVCRTERITGSLTRRSRTCLTREEWRVLDGNNAENIRELQGRASGGHVCTPDPSDPFQGC